MHCSSCRREVPDATNFCGYCGAKLVAQPQPLPVAESLRENSETGRAERRQLTVMFCDLVASTSLSGRLDPEDLREIVRAYQKTCAEVIDRSGGHIAQLQGDGLLIYFGFPTAHEDSPQRAVRTGLGILAAMSRLNERLERENGIRLRVRLGIHTGMVVVGEMGEDGRREHLALGEAPNVAARIEGIAEPDTLVISGETHRLVQQAFECVDLGAHKLQGFPKTKQLFRVIEERLRSSRAAASSRSTNALIGRRPEADLLLSKWRRAATGKGQVVLLSGEPGIGKSHLIRTVKQHLINEGVVKLELRCSAFHQQSAQFPFILHLQRVFEFAPSDPPGQKLGKMEAVLAGYDFALQEIVPLLAALLSVPLPAGAYPPLDLSPARQKQRTQEVLIEWLLQESRRQPLLLIWEDLHWADPSTLEVLDGLIERIPSAQVCLLLTFRPYYQPRWSGDPRWTQLSLDRLERPQVEALIDEVTGGKKLPASVVEQLVDKTDGVPLFVEELTKMVLESGWVRATEEGYQLAGPLPSLAIPSTLQDSLMARLDHLAEAKVVAQLGATAGRKFAYDLLASVAVIDEHALRQGLKKLVQAELIHQRDQPPGSLYVFKHALIQDAAYQSLLRSTRQEYHAKIARALEERFPEMITTHPELLAHHLTEAGADEPAIDCWHRAGVRAAERSENAEAISHLSVGLRVLERLPPGDHRDRRELELTAAIGVPLLTTKGNGAPEVEQAYTRAWELCRQIGDSPELFRVTYGVHAFYVGHTELEKASQLADQLLRLAGDEPALLVPAHWARGLSAYFFGELSAAKESNEAGVALYEQRFHADHALRYGADFGVISLAYLSWYLWLLGDLEGSLARSTEACELADELNHPLSDVRAKLWRAFLLHYRRELGASRAQAEEVIAVSREQGFGLWLIMGQILRGYALVFEDRAAEGVGELERAIETNRKTGFSLNDSYFLALLAEGYRIADRLAEARGTLDRALAHAESTGESLWLAELHRQRGLLELAEAGAFDDRAEASFLAALEQARRQGARSLELRAALDLARLWRVRGKVEAARELLGTVTGAFDEASDAPDLRVARAGF